MRVGKECSVAVQLKCILQQKTFSVLRDWAMLHQLKAAHASLSKRTLLAYVPDEGSLCRGLPDAWVTCFKEPCMSDRVCMHTHAGCPVSCLGRAHLLPSSGGRCECIVPCVPAAYTAHGGTAQVRYSDTMMPTGKEHL